MPLRLGLLATDEIERGLNRPTILVADGPGIVVRHIDRLVIPAPDVDGAIEPARLRNEQESSDDHRNGKTAHERIHAREGRRVWLGWG